MKMTQIGKGLIILLLVSICTLGFKSSQKADAPKSVRTQYINPEDMEQGQYYYFWDHGSGASVAQYDRMENGNIYTTNAITPLQLLLSHNAVFTVYEAGNIQLASALEIIHLQLCVLLGHYVP
jgi:hypothetical protein